MFEETKGFLDLLFNDDDIINFRLIGDCLPTLNKWWSLVKTDICDEINYDFLKQKNEVGYNIYFGGSPRKEAGVDAKDIPKNISDEEKQKLLAKGKGDDSVEICRCCFVDFDHKDFKKYVLWENFFDHIKTLIKKLPPPIFKNLTGGGYHCWWRLNKTLSPDKWKNIQERLIETLGSDGSIKNPERIMRLPGTLNTKRTPLVECKIKEIGTGTTKIEDIEKYLVNTGTKKESVSSNNETKPNQPTWIEDELKRLDLINPKESHITFKGEVLVKASDPEHKNSYRTCMNIFTGKWQDKSHDSHKELKGNGWREGNALKYFTGIAMEKRIAAGKEPKYKQTENSVYKALYERYGAPFEKFIKEELKRLKNAVEKNARVNADYDINEDDFKVIKTLVLNNQQSNLILSLRNPSKTAYYLYKIFYENKIIYRDDFEIYGQTDAVGNEYKFFTMADRLDMIEDTYQLFSCSLQTKVIGRGTQQVEVHVPITDVEPKDVDKVLKRMESMRDIYFNPKKYILPCYRDGTPYDQEMTIPFKDYDWNWETSQKDGDASSDVILHGRLPYNHSPDAKLSEAAWQYLRSTFSEDTIKLIRNVMKYFLTMSHAEQKMFYITGRKGRGKGVLFHIIVELIGRHNFALVSPHTLGLAEKALFCFSLCDQ